MATLGSRENPYTTSEFNNRVYMGTWNGGWVNYPHELTYRSKDLATYTGCCAYDYPVPEVIYHEMMQKGIWTGGWVLTTQNEKKYYSTGGTQYGESLGSEVNPCPMYIYKEMLSNGIWEGGWVRESTGAIFYVQSFQMTFNSGSGSGYGSGSGFGSGSGLGSGYSSGSGTGELGALGCRISAGGCKLGIFRGGNGEIIGELRISWTEGMTIGQNELSVVTISIISKNLEHSFDDNGLYPVWVNAYYVAIRGSFLYTYNHHTQTFSVDSYFVIPEDYRQYE